MASSILWIPIAWDLCSPLLPMDALFVMWIHKFLRGEGLQRVQEVALPWHPQGRRQIDRAETANMAAGRQQGKRDRRKPTSQVDRVKQIVRLWPTLFMVFSCQIECCVRPFLLVFVRSIIEAHAWCKMGPIKCHFKVGGGCAANGTYKKQAIQKQLSVQFSP